MPFLALFRVDKKQLDAASLTDTRSIIHRAVKLPLLQRQPRAQRASHRKCQRRMLAKNKKVTTTSTTTTHYCLPSAQKGAFIFQVFAEKCERPSTLITPKGGGRGKGRGGTFGLLPAALEPSNLLANCSKWLINSSKAAITGNSAARAAMAISI